MIALRRYNGLVAERSLIVGPVEFGVSRIGRRLNADITIGRIGAPVKFAASLSFLMASARRIPARKRPEVILVVGDPVTKVFEPTITPLMAATESLYDRAP